MTAETGYPGIPMTGRPRPTPRTTRGPGGGRGEGMSFGKDQLRSDHVFPHGPDMVPRGYGGVDLDFLFAYRVQVLEHDDSVERREDRVTRIDPLKLLPRPQPHGGRFCGGPGGF